MAFVRCFLFFFFFFTKLHLTMCVEWSCLHVYAQFIQFKRIVLEWTYTYTVPIHTFSTYHKRFSMRCERNEMCVRSIVVHIIFSFFFILPWMCVCACKPYQTRSFCCDNVAFVRNLILIFQTDLNWLITFVAFVCRQLWLLLLLLYAI